MIHPATEVRPVREPIGVGVFATTNIPRGTVVWILDRFDRVVRPEELRAWPAVTRMIAERFGYVDPHGSWVVCWDHGRLMNHSCDPATVSVGDGLEIARRDIGAGDEVTCDYGTLNLTGRLRCLCGARDLSGRDHGTNGGGHVRDVGPMGRRGVRGGPHGSATASAICPR